MRELVFQACTVSVWEKVRLHYCECEVFRRSAESLGKFIDLCARVVSWSLMQEWLPVKASI